MYCMDTVLWPLGVAIVGILCVVGYVWSRKRKRYGLDVLADIRSISRNTSKEDLIAFMKAYREGFPEDTRIHSDLRAKDYLIQGSRNIPQKMKRTFHDFLVEKGIDVR